MTAILTLNRRTGSWRRRVHTNVFDKMQHVTRESVLGVVTFASIPRFSPLPPFDRSTENDAS